MEASGTQPDAKKIHHHIIASHGFLSLWSLPELWRRRSERQRPPPHSPSSARCYFNSFLTRHGARRFFPELLLECTAAAAHALSVSRARGRGDVRWRCPSANSLRHDRAWRQESLTLASEWLITDGSHVKKNKSDTITLTYVFTGMHAMQPNRILCNRMRRHPAASDSFIHAVQSSDTSAAAANAARFCGKHWRLSHS